MTSNAFREPLLARNPTNVDESFDVNALATADEGTRLLMMESPRAAAVFFVDNLGFLRMGAAPEAKTTGGQLEYVLVNSDNEELAVTRLEPSALKNWVGVAPSATLPTFALRGRVLANGEVGGAVQDQAPALFGAPFFVFAKPGGRWIEGRASDPGVQQALGDEYGQKHRRWLELIVEAMGRQPQIQAIFTGLNVDAQDLSNVLGNDCPIESICQGPPTVAITPLSRAMVGEVHEARRRRLGPYAAPTQQPPPAAPQGQGGTLGTEAFTESLAKAITNREDLRDRERLKEGEVRNMGLSMAGDVDVKTGEVSELAWPEATEAYKSALKKTTSREKGGGLKRILDTANRNVPPNCPHAAVRDMANHDPVLVGLIAGGCWSTKPMEALDEKTTEARVACFLPSTEDFVSRIEEETRERNIRSVNGADDDANSRNWVGVNSYAPGWDSVKSMAANLSSKTQAIYDCTIPGKAPLIYPFTEAWTDFFISNQNKNWFLRKNSPEQQTNFLLFAIGSMNNLYCRTMAAG